MSLADEVCDAKKAVRSVRSRTVAAARDAVERPERLQLQAATARLRNAMQLLHGQEWSRLVSIPGLHNKLISLLCCASCQIRTRAVASLCVGWRLRRWWEIAGSRGRCRAAVSKYLSLLTC